MMMKWGELVKEAREAHAWGREDEAALIMSIAAARAGDKVRF